jgi:hypothetical protein
MHPRVILLSRRRRKPIPTGPSGEPRSAGIWIAATARPPSRPFRLPSDEFGLGPAGLGTHPVGSSVPDPVMVACLRLILRRAV